MHEERATRLDQILTALKNHRLVAVFGAVGIVVIAIGSFTDALDSISRLWRRSSDSREGLVQEYCFLLAPVVVQFDRTLDAFTRYTPHDFALEQTLEDGNRKARQLLENNAQFVRPWLDADRKALIQHYDIWLEEYVRLRTIHRDSVTGFIFVGPKGYGFPREAEAHFRARRDSVVATLGRNVTCRA